MGDTVAEEKPAARQKRRVVKNPETFRERAIKANTQSEKPKREHKLRRVPAKVVRPVSEPVAKGTRKLFQIQPFKAIGWFFKQLFRIIGLVVFPKYVRGSFRELKQVTWPNWKLSRQLTYAVLIFAVIFGVSIAIVDWGLGKVFKQILLK